MATSIVDWIVKKVTEVWKKRHDETSTRPGSSEVKTEFLGKDQRSSDWIKKIVNDCFRDHGMTPEQGFLQYKEEIDKKIETQEEMYTQLTTVLQQLADEMKIEMNNTITEQLQQYKTEVQDDLKAKKEEMKNEIAKVTEQLQQHKTEVQDDMKAKKEEIKNEIDKKVTEQLQQHKTEVQDDVKAQTEKIERLSAKVEEQATRMDGVDTTLVRLEKKQENLQLLLDKAKSEETKSKVKLEETKEKIKYVAEMNPETRKHQLEMKKMEKELMKERNELMKTLSDAKQKFPARDEFIEYLQVCKLNLPEFESGKTCTTICTDELDREMDTVGMERFAPVDEPRPYAYEIGTKPKTGPV